MLQGVSSSNPLTCQWLFPCSFRMLKKEIPRQCDLFIELLSSLYSTSHLCGHHPHDLWNCASLPCSQSAGDFRWSIAPFPRVFRKRRTGARADYPIYDDRAVLLPGFETILPDCINPLCVNCAQNERVDSLQIFIT